MPSAFHHRQTIEPDTYWRDYALCKYLDPSEKHIFFPTNPHDADRAARVCEMCPVLRQCNEYATENHVQFGVWAGKPRRRFSTPVSVNQRRLMQGFVGHLRVLPPIS
jgi:Transcription factor WhiB